MVKLFRKQASPVDDVVVEAPAPVEEKPIRVLPPLLEQSPRSKIVICSAIITHLKRVAHAGPVRPVCPYPLGREYVEPPVPSAE